MANWKLFGEKAKAEAKPELERAMKEIEELAEGAKKNIENCDMLNASNDIRDFYSTAASVKALVEGAFGMKLIEKAEAEKYSDKLEKLEDKVDDAIFDIKCRCSHAE